jgi:hypothetical protein
MFRIRPPFRLSRPSLAHRIIPHPPTPASDATLVAKGVQSTLFSARPPAQRLDNARLAEGNGRKWKMEGALGACLASIRVLKQPLVRSLSTGRHVARKWCLKTLDYRPRML